MSQAEVAEPLINEFTTTILSEFDSRIQAIYKIGSSGTHGDFSPCSDVDLVFFLDEVTESDFTKVQALSDKLKSSGLAYADRLSVFWSGTPNQFEQGLGRFPALDRLDLLQHGILLMGHDLRSTLKAPSQQTIVSESAAFIDSFMLTPEKERELKENPEMILQKGARYFTKFVLFPVRLIFTLDHPNTIGSNKDAVEHYFSTWQSAVPTPAALIQFAYDSRQANPHETVNYDPQKLQTELLPLYEYCLKRYKEAKCPTL